MECSNHPAKAKAGRVPFSILPSAPHQRTQPRHASVPTSASAGDLQHCAASNLDARGCHNKSTDPLHHARAVRGNFKRALQVCKPASLCIFQICESDGPPSLSRFSLLIIIR